MSSNKKPVTKTIKIDRYDPQQYYEGGYGEEEDESEDYPEQDYRRDRQLHRNDRVEQMRVFRSP